MSEQLSTDALDEIVDALPDEGFSEDVLSDGIDFGTHEPRFGTHAPDFGVDTSADVLGLDQPAAQPASADAPSVEDEDDMLDPEVAFRDLDLLLTDDIDYGDDIPGTVELNDSYDPQMRVIGGDVDEIDTGPDMLDMLNEASIGPDFGVGTPDGELPEFGIDEDPDFGTGEDDGGAAWGTPLFAEEDLDDDVTVIHQELVGEDLLEAALESEEVHGEPDYNYELTSSREDIVGEIDDSDILGALEDLGHDTGFKQYEIERAAMGTPMLVRRNTPMERREWQLDLGPASAPAGEQLTFYSQPQYHFRTEKVVATDSVGGAGTRILSVQVGHRLQRPAGGGQGALTSFFAQTALGNGQLWDTCQPALTISMTVSFVQACTFDCTIFGSAII
jgi:hypothetical protein